jgi:hypothetical protein
MHLPGLLPWATLVHESMPVVDHKPAFLFPPPLLRFANDVAFLALEDALYRGIFIYMDQRFYYYDGKMLTSCMGLKTRQLKII